jgi:uncharacterized membrane protein YhiD involved in acid resistance
MSGPRVRLGDGPAGVGRYICALGLALWVSAIPLVAQQGAALPSPAPSAQAVVPSDSASPDRAAQIQMLRHAAERLPVAAGLAVLLALRPRRRGTPPRQAQVVQTQIILAVVGAVVMLVVGASLARAFGIVGAAGLVRYRAKIDDPKDAGVMLSTLAVGLASGVGLWMLAAFSAAFVLVVLWIVESFEPQARQLFTLTVTGTSPEALRPRVERLLGRQRLEFELRASTAENLTYEVRLPLDAKVDRLSKGLLDLDSEAVTGVNWEQKKEKK